ncbi:diguanylate cyclase domain-containing protein [Blastococcus sp. SYSU D00820]
MPTTIAYRPDTDDRALAERQGALLRELGVLDRPVQAELRAVLRLAVAVTGARHAALNLLDTEQQVTIAAVGAERGCHARVESLCARTSRRPGVFWSRDLRTDPDYAGNPFVDGRIGRLRFYGSAPMRADGGLAIGTVCVWDEEPLDLRPEQVAHLADLADVALGLIQRDRAVQQAAELTADADRARAAAERSCARAEQVSADLARARALDSALFDALSVGVVVSDLTGMPTRANRVASRWSGERWGEERLDRDRLIEHLYHADGTTPMTHEDGPLARVLRGEEVRDLELVAGHPDGPRRVSLASAEPIRDEHGGVIGAVATITDITAQRDLERRLREAALHDPLTGLPNRALLLDRLGQALAAQARAHTPSAVVYCDLDGFKAVNDSLGHDAGDAALLGTAAALRSVVRPEDTVARIGGDEFVVLCPGMGTAEDARRLIDRIGAAIEASATGVGASCGFALSRPGDSADSLLRRADTAMYAVKRSRR